MDEGLKRIMGAEASMIVEAKTLKGVIEEIIPKEERSEDIAELDRSIQERVKEIRLRPGLKAFEKKREVSSLVIRQLEKEGKFIRTQAGDLYYFRAETRTLEALDDEDFKSRLYERFGLNSTEDETRFAEREIITTAMRQGERVDVHHLAFWNDGTKRLYISANNGLVYLLNGKTVRTVDNGTDGVLFLSDRRADPIDPDLSAGVDSFDVLFADLNLAGDEIIKAHNKALSKVWTLALFFGECLPVRPIQLLVGEQNSGKTSHGRRIGLAFYGKGFDVGNFRSDWVGEQDFLATVTARRLVVFDNADARIKWLPDHLAKLATGGEIERRKLYTTNTLVSFRPDCFLILTSRDPRWKRDDVARRLLPIRMEKIEGSKIPEWNLQKTVIKNRPRIWGAFLTILNQVVASIQSDTGTFASTHRLADFHWFGSLAAPVLGIEQDFKDAMENLDKEQLGLLGEGDERLDLLARWIECRPQGWAEETISSPDLFEQLRQMHVGPERAFPFKSPTALGSWLGRHRDLIENEAGVSVASERSQKNRWWSFINQRCHPKVSSDKPLENKGKNGNDIMTPCPLTSCQESIDL